MPDRPTINVMCGLVAAGKTTLARQLARELSAVRLSRDEWMIRLFELSYDDPRYVDRLGPCTELLWDVAMDVAEAGSSVILDWNFWSRERRAEAKRRASTAGFPIQLHWLDVPLEVAIARAAHRSAQAHPRTHPIDEAGVRHFSTIFEPPAEGEGLPIVRHG